MNSFMLTEKRRVTVKLNRRNRKIKSRNSTNCNHTMGLLFESADYTLFQLNRVPEERSCTSLLLKFKFPKLNPQIFSGNLLLAKVNPHKPAKVTLVKISSCKNLWQWGIMQREIAKRIRCAKCVKSIYGAKKLSRVVKQQCATKIKFLHRCFSHVFCSCGVCITASGNILASGNISLKLIMAPLEAIELLIFWYVVAEHHIVQL